MRISVWGRTRWVVSHFCPALRVLVLALAVLGHLLAVIATAIAAFRFLRSVPRAFGLDARGTRREWTIYIHYKIYLMHQ